MVGLSMLAKQDTLSLIGCASLLSWAHLFGVYRFVGESPSFFARRGNRAKTIERLEALCLRNRTLVDCTDWTFVERANDVAYSALLSAGTEQRAATLSCCYICATINYANYGLLYMMPMLIENSAHGALLGVVMSFITNAFATAYAHRFSRRALMLGKERTE